MIIKGTETIVRGAFGPGNRAYLYTCSSKKSNTTSFNGAPPDLDTRATEDRSTARSKLEHKKTQAKSIKKWNHFDSNMNNNLVEQRKILYSKNYELDSRAWGLKDYGIQPYMGSQYNKQRQIDSILFDQTRGKDPGERVPYFKKNYTPITTYMKSLYDCRVTKEGAGKITSLRPYLNYS